MCVVCVESRLSLSVCYRVVALPLSRRLGVRDRAHPEAGGLLPAEETAVVTG